ncbi:MAG: hypothetical protein RL431_929 [Actinomycetota bacterium]
MVEATLLIASPPFFDPGEYGTGFGGLVTRYVFGIVYFASVPGLNYLIPVFTIFGLLLVVCALMVRLTQGRPARVWWWAYWVTFAGAVAGISEIIGVNFGQIQGFFLVYPQILQMLFSYLILRAGNTPGKPRKAFELGHDVGPKLVTGFLKTKLAAAFLLPVGAVYLWFAFKNTTLWPYDTFIRPDENPFWIWFTYDEFRYLVSFGLIAATLVMFVWTRKPGKERFDLLPVAQISWAAGVVLATVSFVFKTIPGIESYEAMFNGDFLSSLATFLSLGIIALTPGISPFEAMRTARWRDQAINNKPGEGVQ